MNPLLEKLHDIDSIDAISIWPLAIGWWFLMVISFCLFLVICLFMIRWIRFKRSWKNDTLKKLSSLENCLNADNVQKTAVLFSEYLKRMALRKYPRSESANLTGKEWLKWLSAHDLHKFDWEKEASFLKDISYAPLSNEIDEKTLRQAIRASKSWVN